MSSLSPVATENLIMTGFALIVVDRTFALWVVSLKARRILAKRKGKGDTRTVPYRLLEWIDEDYGFVQAFILLSAYGFLGLLQTIKPDLILNEAGKAGFGLIGFLVSVGSTVLNSFIEKLDAKP